MKKKRADSMVILSEVSFPLLLVSVFSLVVLLTSGGMGFSEFNFFMLNVSFVLIILSYLFGLQGALILSMTTVFVIASWCLYNSVFNGVPINTNLYFWSGFILISSLLAGTNKHSIAKMQKENIAAKKAISSFSTIDTETDLYNQKALVNDLGIITALARRNVFPVTLMMITPRHVGNLRRIIGADRFPYLLKELSSRVKHVTRDEDRMYLVDDDCIFAVILVTDLNGAEIVRDKVKEVVEDCKFDDIVPPLLLNVEISVANMTFNSTLNMSVMDFIVITQSRLEYDVSTPMRDNAQKDEKA